MKNFDEEFMQRYDLAIERIAGIMEESDNNAFVKPSMKAYFEETTSFIGKLNEIKRLVETDSLRDMDETKLKKLNDELYAHLITVGGEDYYQQSFLSPDFAGTAFAGDFDEKRCYEAAKMLSALYVLLHSSIQDIYQKRFDNLTIKLELFLEIYGVINDSEDDESMLKAIKNSMYYFAYDYAEEYMEDNVRSGIDEELDFILSIIMNSDLNETKYLYFYGECIGKNEIEVSKYLASLGDDKIRAMASTYVEGYVEGFNYAGIDLGTKRTVNIRYNIGFERIIKEAVIQFREIGLEPVIYLHGRDYRKASPRRVGVVTTALNSQYEYDHRYDLMYFANKPLLDRYLVCTRLACEKYAQKASVYAGPACVEVFGEKPFIPKNSKYAVSPDKKAMKLLTAYNQDRSILMDEFINLSQTSFTIIAYPIPEIGEKFAEIFDETIRINTLDKVMYRRIQEKLIDALNEGVGAHVVGMNGNKTDITVAFAPMTDPQKETIFENCLADVNIPVGEVFTSPKLKGTNGVLNVSRVYLNELEYRNLTITFKDGMIDGYSCSNFDDEEKCKKYIEENVMFGHDSLPMGEFAIGTNTAAYTMARKYEIADKLPILIAEKTGPHFAVGDTCYSMSEDNRVYNPDGKEIIAKDNEVSILRKTDMQRAYFNCHTDITIPYDELGYIDVIRGDGTTIRLIENGRFVLEGCEKLNEELDY